MASGAVALARASRTTLFVAAGAQQDADGCGVKLGLSQVLVDPGGVEAELAEVGRLETADLELNDD